MPQNSLYKVREISTVVLALSYQFVFGIFLTINESLFPLNADSKGVSRSIVGLISGISDIASAVCGLCFPQILHLLNMKTFFWSGMAFLSGSNLCFGLLAYIDNRSLYICISLFLRILIGVGYSACWASLFPILLSFYPNRTGLMSALTVIAFESGSIVGPGIAVIFSKIGGFSLPYMITGIFGMCVTVCCIFIMLPSDRQGSKTRCKVISEEIEIIQSSISSRQLTHSERNQILMSKVLTSRKILLTTIPYAINYSLLGVLGVFFSPFLVEIIGVAETNVGFYFIPQAVAALSLSPLIGLLVDLRFKWTVFFMSPILGALGCFLMGTLIFYEGAFAPFALFFGLILARGVSYITGYVAGLAILHDVFREELKTSNPTDYRFLMSAWTNTWSKAGVTFGSIVIGGLVFDFTGYTGAILVECFMFLLSILLSCLSFWAVSKENSETL